MATISSSIRLTDSMTPAINTMLGGMNSMVAGFEEIEKAGKRAADASVEVGRRIEEAGTKMKSASDKMKSVGKSMTTALTLPVIGIGAAAIKVGSDFEAGMSEVAAISGATGKELDDLRKKAEEMGKTTKFSASESAEALKYMSMAGWDAAQMTSGLDGVMALAAASGEDLGMVSDIVTDALTAFKMEAKDASGFADLLANAASNSNTNVAMLGESFKYVAPLFGSMGYSAEDAALALGLMANAGIKGSQSGTSLKTAIANLTNPTSSMQTAMTELGLSVTDANGGMLPFKDTMDQLRDRFSGLSESQQAQYAATIFGKEAMSGMLAIVNASNDDYTKLIDSTRNYSGAAEEMAGIMEDNLQGQLTKLKSALEGVGIQIFEILVPHLNTLVNKIQGLVDSFAALDPGMEKAIVKSAVLVAAIGPIISIIGRLGGRIAMGVRFFGTLTSAIGVMTTGAVAATPAIAGMASALTFLTGPIGIAVMALAALTAGLGYLYIKKKNDVGMTKEQIEENNKFIKNMDNTIESINSGIRAREESLRSSELEIIAAKTLADKMFELSDKQNKSAYELSVLTGYVDEFNQIMPNANLLIDEQTGALNLTEGAVWDLIGAEEERIRLSAATEMLTANKKAEYEATLALSEAAEELIRLEAEKSAAAEAALALGGSRETMERNVAAATGEYNDKIAEAKTRQEELAKSSEAIRTEGEKINDMISDPAAFAEKEANQQASLAADTIYVGSALEIVEQYGRESKTKMNEAHENLFTGLWDGLIAEEYKAKTAGEQTGTQAGIGVANGLEDEIKNINASATKTTGALINTLNSNLQVQSPSKVTTRMGNDVGDGLVKGLGERERAIRTGGDSAATALKNSFKTALGISSPSTVFRQYGYDSIDGLIAGLSTNEIIAFSEGIVADIKRAFEAGDFNIQVGMDFLGDGAAEFFQSIGVGGATIEGLVKPLDGAVTSGFGWRSSESTDGVGSNWHQGIDIGAASGATVGAAGAGKVTTAGWYGGYGNTVIIDHSNGLETLYAHLSAVLVSVGQMVTAGQAIGRVGSTGNSTGPHLHFGIYKDGVAIDPGSLWGYARGTRSATSGLHWVGENGPELLNFRGGESVLESKKSMDLVKSVGSVRKSDKAKVFSPKISISMGDTIVNDELDVDLITKKIGKKLQEEIMTSVTGIYDLVS